MQPENAYFSEEYQAYRRSYDYVYQDQYIRGKSEKQLPDNQHSIITTFYDDASFETRQYWVHSSITSLYNSHNVKVAEIRCINNDGAFFSVVEHSNGKNYLLFRIDLYGYSVMDLSTYAMYHYVPMNSFKVKEETFIWTNVLYCKLNNILAVDGCYWASPFSTECFDLSNPKELPYRKVFDSCELEGEISIDNDITPMRWNEDGSIVLSCYTDEEGNSKIQKTLSIISC